MAPGRISRPVLIAAVVVVAGALAIALGLLRAARSLDDPEVQQALLARLRDASGVDVRAAAMEVALSSGIRLTGVTIANPAPLPGNALSAEAVVLRYRLLPLLRGRLEIDAFSQERINVTLKELQEEQQGVAHLL